MADCRGGGLKNCSKEEGEDEHFADEPVRRSPDSGSSGFAYTGNETASQRHIPYFVGNCAAAPDRAVFSAVGTECVLVDRKEYEWEIQ